MFLLFLWLLLSIVLVSIGEMAEWLLGFNAIFKEVKADRLKNSEIMEENYVNHNISNHISPKTEEKKKNHDAIACCEDLTEDLWISSL